MKEKIVRLLKTKGYYFVLALCVLTVGGVSFLSYRNAQRERAATPLTQEQSQGVEKVKDDVPAEPESAEQDAEPAPQAEPQAEPAAYSAPLEGEVIAHYSPERPLYSYTLKDWRVHNGLDIAAPAGTQVLNVSAGRVEEAGTDDLMGNYAVIRHTDGRVSRYASLGSVTVTEGQVVAMGEPIGTVGTTMLLECGETAHLHYELRAEGKPVDPSFIFER